MRFPKWKWGSLENGFPKTRGGSVRTEILRIAITGTPLGVETGRKMWEMRTENIWKMWEKITKIE